jgi:AraC family ethanolamine operon transcriptional activator
MNSEITRGFQHAPPRSESRQEIVERAETLLRAHIGQSLSLGRLCRVLGVKERSLRNAFYAVRGMSPKQAVRNARLHEVRRALQDASVKKGMITHVATDYGFYDLGRFAGTYKAMFGETPSKTLQAASTGR